MRLTEEEVRQVLSRHYKEVPKRLEGTWIAGVVNDVANAEEESILKYLKALVDTYPKTTLAGTIHLIEASAPIPKKRKCSTCGTIEMEPPLKGSLLHRCPQCGGQG